MNSKYWLTMAFCGFVLSSNPVLATGKDQGHGQVILGGSIIETPCSIDTQSRDQSIDMNATPISVIARDGQGDTHTFSINLVNCDLAQLDANRPDWRFFRVSFDGAEDKGLFALGGNAHGVALKLTDEFGHIARPGVPLPSGNLISGSQKLNYNLRLVGNEQVLKTGDFRTVLRFKIDYN